MQNLNLLWFEVQSFLAWNQKGRICINAIVMHNTKVENSQNCLSTSVQLSKSSGINWAHGGSPSFVKLSGVGCAPPHKPMDKLQEFSASKSRFFTVWTQSKRCLAVVEGAVAQGGHRTFPGAPRAGAPAGLCCCSDELEKPQEPQGKAAGAPKCQGQITDPEHSASPTWAGLQTRWNLPLNNWK